MAATSPFSQLWYFNLRPWLQIKDTNLIPTQIFNTALHIDMYIMVFNGGFSFHVQDVAMRFGPDVLTVFFKVGLFLQSWFISSNNRLSLF